ncbi:MAG: TrmB family transcriptional regulator, partial [Halobacteria archaeon]|nr:TrmB family transcriptional regulator [Halobacteria archaeon]
DSILESLREASEKGVSVVIGVKNDEIREKYEEKLPSVEIFVSGLEWLTEPTDEIDTSIGRMILVDKKTILTSSVNQTSENIDDEQKQMEKAVFGTGFDNGLVVIARRLMSTGLLPADDPDKREREQ